MSDINKNWYGIIPASVRYCKGLNPNAKLLYSELTALTSEKGYCYATNAYFADLYDVDKSTISRWVSLLQNFGFIKIILKRNINNQVVERRIYITETSTYTQDCNEGIANSSIPYTQDCNEGIRKIAKENITFNNTYDLNSLSADSEPRQNYSKKIFELWQNSGLDLPGSKDLWSFQNKEFKNAMQYLKGIHSDNVIQACKNYFEVLKLKGFYQHLYNFENFVKHIDQFLPDNFRLNNYTDWTVTKPKKKEMSVSERNHYMEKHYADDPRYDHAFFEEHFYEWLDADRPIGEDYFKWSEKIK